jgi:hypothetical protein
MTSAGSDNIQAALVSSKAFRRWPHRQTSWPALRSGVFRYRVQSERDAAHWGVTSVNFDANDGHRVGACISTGKAAGDTSGPLAFSPAYGGGQTCGVPGVHHGDGHCHRDAERNRRYDLEEEASSDLRATQPKNIRRRRSKAAIFPSQPGRRDGQRRARSRKPALTVFPWRQRDKAVNWQAIRRSITVLLRYRNFIGCSMRIFISALLAFGTLAGCTVTPPSIRLDPIPVIQVERGGPPHCPPGQAKKGRC